MKAILIVLSFILLGTMAMAQSSDVAAMQQTARANTFGAPAAANPFSLIDLSRVRWSNSYSVGFFSGGMGSGSMGLWNSSMFYDFSPKLSLALNVGIMHNLGGNLWGNGRNNALLLPGFRLDYHPSRNFQLSVGVQRSAGWLAPGYGDDWRPYYPY